MSTSDCRDVRVYFNDMCFFTVEKLLMNLEKFSKRGTVDELIARNLKLGKKASELAQEQFARFAPVFRMFT
jgi:hypothetical protein